MVRTRFAPSPTGYMHIGNLRTALYAYLIAKSNGGKFILRIEDTDRDRFVEDAVQVIYDTLKTAGITYDEGPDIGGDYGPYIQSERKSAYLEYAKKLIETGNAYYCFCDKDSSAAQDGKDTKYDRRCLKLSKEEIEQNLADGKKYVIRQLIPDGKTAFTDLVYGEITVDNSEIEDQILIKSDLLPTYNFANVADDHLMNITHVVRGSEYLSSTPKYNLLYQALGWEVPLYVHLPMVLNENGEKLSKRSGHASFADLIEQGFLPEAVINYIALLGWSPPEFKETLSDSPAQEASVHEPRVQREIFSLDELVQYFDIKNLSKAPSRFDIQKLTWLNGEYFKKMPGDVFYEMAHIHIKEAVKTENMDFHKLAAMVKTRIEFLSDIKAMLDFIDVCPEYDVSLYTHKKMKTDPQIARTALKAVIAVADDVKIWDNASLYEWLTNVAQTAGLKNSQVLWPVRTALSGKPVTPCGASELMELLGKDESVLRIKRGIEVLGGK